MAEARPQTALGAQVSALGEEMQRGFAEMKTMLQGIEVRVRAIETAEAGTHPLINSRLDAAWRRIDALEAQVDVLKKAVGELQQTNRLLAWIGGILGSTVLIWLVTQILKLVNG